MRSVRARACLALLALLLLPGCAGLGGGEELEALRRENERSRGEVAALRGELAGRPPASEGSEPKLEQVFVPRSRVSVEVT